MIRKTINTAILFCLCISVSVFTSCKKKDKASDEPTVVAVPDGQSGTDNREVQSENDAAINDINEIISYSSASGRNASSAQTTGICGLATDSAKIKKDTILLNFTGVTCLNRTRTGSIRLTWASGTKWKNAGASIKIEYLNYKIVRASDQKSIKLNGIQYLTNVSGGTWLDLYFVASTTLVTTVTGTNLQVTFEDNKTAVYNINRKVTYTFPSSILTVKAEGIGNSGALTNLENFGTTRAGDPFTSQVTTPIIWNATCGGAVLQGAVNIQVPAKTLDLKFLYGVDANGNSFVAGPNSCPFGWKLEWTFNSTTNSKVFAYN